MLLESKRARVAELVTVPAVATIVILAHAYMDTILMVQMYLGAGPAG